MKDITKEENIYEEDSFASDLQKALDAGLTLVEALPDELFIDLDSATADRYIPTKLLQIIQCEGNWILDSAFGPSKSGNFHLVIKLGRAVSDELKPLMQMAGGSDPVREFLYHKRYVNKSRRVLNCLFVTTVMLKEINRLRGV